MARADSSTRERLRWETAEGDGPQGRLFATPTDRVRHPEFRDLEFIHVRAKSIINDVPAASRMPFRHTINVYRGCSHACSYCFARPTHEYLNLDAGRDFDSVIVVKTNAVELLRAELHPRRWQPAHIAMGTNTDPYQRAEGRYRLTRGVIETLTEASNPFSILTKSALVLRDLDVLTEANERTDIGVSFSIGSLDTDVWRGTEPGTPHPRRRVEAVAALRDAGIRSGVLVAPILPGISDSREQLREVIGACIEAGASSISPIVLHLRPGVKEQFMPWLEEHRLDLVERYEELYPGAYVAKDEQRRISRLVDDLIAELGGPRRGRTGMPRRSRRPSPPARDEAAEASEQMSLGL